MDIGATEQARAVQLNTIEQARQIAVAQRTDQFSQQGLSPGGQAANVTTSTNYSPSLYAQAAQFQLYTSAGTLTGLLQQSGAVVANDAPFHDAPDDIHAVESTDATGIDTRA